VNRCLKMSDTNTLKPLAVYYTAGQFSTLRILVGLYLIYFMSSLLPFYEEVFGLGGVLSDASLNFTYGYFLFTVQDFKSEWLIKLFLMGLISAASLLTLGLFRRISSFVLWFGLATLFHSNNLIIHPGLPFLGFMLLCFCLVPKGEPLTPFAKEQKSSWSMPPLLYYGAFAVLAFSYTASGLHKLIHSPSWLDGSALMFILESPLARDSDLGNLLTTYPYFLTTLTYLTLLGELLFLPLAISPLSRKYIWILMTLMHLGVLALVNFPELTLSILLFHFFIFDSKWLSLKKEFALVEATINYFKRRYLYLLLACCTGALWGLSFLISSGLPTVLLAIVVTLLVALLLFRWKVTYFEMFCLALSGHLLAFFWVKETYALFNDSSSSSAWMVLIALSSLSAMQFVLFKLVYEYINFGALKRLSLSMPMAWLCLEMLYHRPLPWAHGHTQLDNLYLSQIADLAGPSLISFLLFWWAALLVTGCLRKHRLSLNIFLLSFILVSIYGVFRVHQMGQILEQAEELRVGVIQGNTPPRHFDDDDIIDYEISDYLSRSSSLYRESQPELIVWPESAVDRSFFLGVTEIDPGFDLGNESISAPLLFGGVSVTASGSDRFGYYNSAYLLDPAGSITGIYHKNLPFPFGEAYPFQEYFSVLQNLSPATMFQLMTDIEPKPLLLSRDADSPGIEISTVVCFESITPSIFRKLLSYEKPGVIVEVSNHNWFGKSRVSHQHHMLAAWRSIENRRHMIRVSNVGFSASIDPLGRTISQLDSAQALERVFEVKPLKYRSLYSYFGDTPLYYFSLLILLLFLLRLCLAGSVRIKNLFQSLQK